MSWAQLIQNELRAVFQNRVLLLTVFGGVVFYSFLYPLPYSQQLPREQAVVVVNLDASATSRKLIRMVDATPQVKITSHASSITEAKQQIIEQGITGMLVIPRHFYRDLLLQRTPVISYSGDASWFLVYSTVIEGLVSASETLKAQVKVNKLLIEGVPLASAKHQFTSIGLNLRPSFNVTTGYVYYVVPAIFVLILHQTLLIGMGLIGGTQNEMEQGYWQHAPIWKMLLIRCLILVAIYLLLILYYFGFSYQFYGINRLADPLQLMLLALPFLLATSMLGIVIGTLIPRREIATLLVMLGSLPLIFSAGIVWPSSLLPGPINFFAQLFPATPGMQAFVRLNQMGADFSQVFPLFKQMLWQATVYALLAWALIRRWRWRINASLTPDAQANSA